MAKASELQRERNLRKPSSFSPPSLSFHRCLARPLFGRRSTFASPTLSTLPAMDAAIYFAQRNLEPPTRSRGQATASNAAPGVGEQAQAGEEQYISTFFCRAVYDYQTNDASSLSFRRGDIIEVLTQLESGWWDGLLGDERGWFPSNYVVLISDQEAEAALGPSEFDAPQSTLGDDSAVVDMAHSMSNALSQSDHDGDWLDREPEYTNVARPNGAPNGRSTNGTQHHDFWEPRVGSDGRVSIAD